MYSEIKNNLKEEDDINADWYTRYEKASPKLSKKIQQAIEILEKARDAFRKESGSAVSGRYNSALSALRAEADKYSRD